MTTNIIIMRKKTWLAACLMAAMLAACGQKGAKQDAAPADSTAVEATQQQEAAAEQEAAGQFATPQELADFAVECYRTGEREKLLSHMTANGARKLREEMAIEEQRKADKSYARSLAEMRETLANSTYTCRGEESLGAQNKQYSYKSKPSGYNLRVLLELVGDEWKVDLVGPGR